MEYIVHAVNKVFRFVEQIRFRAFSLTFCNEGIRIDSSSAMIAMTTSNSISVNPFFLCKTKQLSISSRIN